MKPRPWHFQKTAYRELLGVARRYEELRRGLGDEFLDAIDQALDVLERTPTPGVRVVHAPTGMHVRKVLVERFPFALILLVRPRSLRILAVAHLKREPGYWLGRLPRGSAAGTRH